MTEMIEGDLVELKSMYIRLISFFRRNNVEVPFKTIISEMREEIKGFKFPGKNPDPKTQNNIE